MGSIILEHSAIFFHENGIVEIRFKDDVDIELSEIQKQEKIILSNLDASERIFLLVVPGENSSMGKGVKEFSKKHSVVKKRIAAHAVIVNSLAHRLALNFFLKYSKRNMRMFDNRDLAFEWLLKEMKKKKHESI